MATLTLINAFETTIDKIRKQQSVWVRIEDTDKWYHTYDRVTVNARVSKIKETIEALENPFG